MKNLEYNKINLRDFRHNLTQLKDSLADGVAYEVIEKGNSLGYFIPAQYEIKVKEKKSDTLSRKEFLRVLEKLQGSVELKDEVKHFENMKDAYHFLLDKKYNKGGKGK